MMMIYEYKCGHCENVQEGIRSVANREDAPVCRETSLIISIAGGFKISGSGVHSPGFSSRSGRGRYKFAEGVGPLDKRSKAYQKKQDDASSKHYGPGQSCSMDSKEFKRYSQTRDGMDQGRSRFDK
jgi:hypothetical protein